MNKHTIFWADDDQDDLELFRDVLLGLDHGHQLRQFTNGRALLEALRQHETTPCLIVLDLNMPLMNGWDTLQHLKQHPQWQNIPVVVLTTSAHERDRAFCARYDTPLISKPTDYSRLLKVVGDLLHICSHPEKHVHSEKSTRVSSRQ